jgi:hypothetical protein
MESMRTNNPVCIIIAAGEGTRWNDYLGRRKHFIEIEGEPLIARIVRLARRFSSKIYVVGNTPDHQINGSTLFHPELNPLNYDADKFLSSASLWNQTGRTVVFYGDVYFSEDAIKRIMEFQPREWTLFARFGPSKLTGKKYGECFAHSFYPEHIAGHLAGLQHIVSEYSKGEIKRCGGWEHYRSMEHLPLEEHQRKGSFVEINDWTDDFDFPEDYDRWVASYHKRGLIAWIRRFRNARNGHGPFAH